MPGLAVIRPEIRIARRDDTYHVLVVCFQELDHGFRRVPLGSRAAVARRHEDVGVVNLFPARDLHRPGVESICYGLGAPGVRTPVVDDRPSDNTPPLAYLVLILCPLWDSNPHTLTGTAF